MCFVVTAGRPKPPFAENASARWLRTVWLFVEALPPNRLPILAALSHRSFRVCCTSSQEASLLSHSPLPLALTTSQLAPSMAATLSLQAAAAAGAVACSARCRAAAAVQAWRPAGAAGRGQQQRRSVSSNRALLGGRRASAAASDSSAGGLATHGEPRHLHWGDLGRLPCSHPYLPPLLTARVACPLLPAHLPLQATPPQQRAARPCWLWRETS